MKSPIKDKPLRNPGQSLDRRIFDVTLDRQVKYVFYGMIVWVALMSNWVYYFTEKPRPPFWFTLFVLVFFAYCYYKIKTATKEIEPLKQVIKETIGKDFDVKGICKNSDFFVSARKHRAENRSVLEVHEDSSTGLTWQSREKCSFKGVLKKVVLFPGRFIGPTAEPKQSDVWVLNPKALPAFISNSGVQLSGEEVGLVGFHLSRFVRAAG